VRATVVEPHVALARAFRLLVGATEHNAVVTRKVLDESLGSFVECGHVFSFLLREKHEPMTYDGIARVLSATTLATVGIDISAHLFRAAGATTSAIYGGDTPHLASALLQHTDRRVTEAHYNRATNATAARTLQSIIDSYLC
jgi:integrase